jgi:alkylated DNA repair dioxygenase AlkB
MNNASGEIHFGRAATDVLTEVAERGHLHVPEFVTSSVVSSLQHWVGQQRFTRHDFDTGAGVRQRLETVEPQDMEIGRDGTFFISAVERWVCRARSHWPSLEQWQASDVAVQRYRANDGIGPHRDYRRQHGPVIVVTLAGEAEFNVHPTRWAPPGTTYHVQPGDGVFLRGDLGFQISERPVHSVSAPLGFEPRISLGLRHDKRVKRR